MADLRDGTVLGERFEIVGVLGRGGTATVYLAHDRLRGQRLALKVLHPHLAHDPAMRDRLRREVAASGVLRHEAALVAHDLHELDGLLALSLPYHPGTTLAERVATGGPLPPEQVRALGLRIADALAEAHRKGLLHRDVTPNNVLIGSDGAGVLTDFGLARLAEPGAARSTGVVGTAGYAAPEIYAGTRRDPRSDLYGLGGVLYLAATGHPPYEAATPMASLQRQLAEEHVPVAEAAPGLPPDLVALIERLLRNEPDLRPQGAREVVDALELGVVGPDPAAARSPLTAPRQHLPPGRWTVLVKESPEDFQRRYQARRSRYRHTPAAERHVRRWAQQLASGLRQTLGIEEEVPPEAQLVAEVARTAGIPEEALATAPEIYEAKFRLVDGVDRPTAQRLCRRARELGFRASVEERPAGRDPELVRRWPAILGAAWAAVGVAAALQLPVEGFIVMMLILTVVGSSLLGRQRPNRRVARAPVAYLADLSGHLEAPWVHLALQPEEGGDGPAEAPEQAGREGVTPGPETHGQRLAARARASLDGLERAIGEQSELPALAVRDLRRTVAELRTSAASLAQDVDRIEAALADGGPGEGEWLQGRIARLETLQRAGEPVDAQELARLRAALEAHRADRAAADALESQLTACQARLLEIASAASRVRRELLSQPATTHTADQLVARLQTETRAADEARREAGRRHAAMQRQGGA